MVTMPKWKTFWLPLAILAVLFLFSPLQARAAPRYEIIATFDRSGHRISGAELIYFDNISNVPLSEIDLFLYPNIYLEKEPLEKLELTQKAYPRAFNPGQITLSAVQNEEGQDLIYLYEKSFSAVRVFLQKPILPGERGRFRIFFTTLIPEKWGTFGHYRDVTYLQGGWHPYLAPLSANGWDPKAPPAKSDFQILLTLDRSLEVVSSGPRHIAEEHGGEKVLLLEGKEIPFYTLVITQGYRETTLKKNQTTIVYTHSPDDQKIADQVTKIVEEVVDYFSQRYGKIDLPVIRLAEVYLYQDLVAPGEGVLFLSSRLFKVFSYLKRYHEATLAREVFFFLWKQKLAWEEEWVSEGLADQDLKTYLTIKYGGETNLKRLLKPIAFFPIIDQILYSKELPLRQVYFKEASVPAFNEDIRLLGAVHPPGGAIFIKLKNLLGQEILDRIINEYLLRLNKDRHPVFARVSQELSEKDLKRFYNQWLRNNPVVDFSLDKAERKSLNGSYETHIEVSKTGDGVEPLKIVVREANGNEMSLVWDGKGKQHQETLVTPAPIEFIELDPPGEVNDSNRFNNRDPHLWKVLLNRIGAGYDFQTQQINYNIEIAFQRVHDDRNNIITSFTHNEQLDGGKVSYTHVFLNSQGVTPSISVERPRLTHFPEKTSGILGIAYRFSYPQVPLAVEYVQRISGTVPPINFSLSYSQRFTGGEYDAIVELNLDMRKVIYFSNYHAFALRAFLGESTGELFKGNRYFLGGESGMRGYTPLVFGGDNMFLFSAEYRFPLLYETDVNLVGLALSHTIQGALFADAGMVTDDHNTFQFQKYLTDVGVSLRFFLDMLGFYPTVYRFDVAYPIDSPLESERNPHYYLSAGQPF
jgi:hypothetical protein